MLTIDKFEGDKALIEYKNKTLDIPKDILLENYAGGAIKNR